MFLQIILAIAAISVLLALNSLRKLSHKEEIEGVKKELQKAKVIFQSESSSDGI